MAANVLRKCIEPQVFRYVWCTVSREKTRIFTACVHSGGGCHSSEVHLPYLRINLLMVASSTLMTVFRSCPGFQCFWKHFVRNNILQHFVLAWNCIVVQQAKLHNTEQIFIPVWRTGVKELQKYKTHGKSREVLSRGCFHSPFITPVPVQFQPLPLHNISHACPASNQPACQSESSPAVQKSVIQESSWPSLMAGAWFHDLLPQGPPSIFCADSYLLGYACQQVRTYYPNGYQLLEQGNFGVKVCPVWSA